MAERRVLFLALLLAFVHPAQAAEPEVQICGLSLGDVGVSSWEQFSTGPAEQALESGNVRSLYTALTDELDRVAEAWPNDFAQLARSRMDELASGRLAPADWTLGESPRTPNGLDFQAYVFGLDRRIWLPGGSDEDECAESPNMPQARAQFAAFVNLVERAYQEFLPVESLQQELADLELKYDKYLFEGYPMYPWEAAVNSWFLTNKHIADGPPRWQLALMHPSAGLIGHVASDTDGDIGAILLVEPVGLIRYTKDYKHWFGASLATSFPFDREPGIGFALTYNQFKVGVTWHDDPDGRYDGVAVVLGIELYQFFGRQVKKYDGYKARVKALVDESQVAGGGAD